MHGMVVYRARDGIDAIDQYSRRLVQAIGEDARYVDVGLAHARRRAAEAEWILLQYNPFGYGRWGLAPGLVRDAMLVRRRTGVPLGLMVHESWVDMRTWRTTVMGTWQRVQLRSLLRIADIVMASTQALARQVGRGAVHVPVGSNIAPIDITPSEARARLGLEDQLVVTMFGRGHPARALGHAEAAIAALADACGAQTMTVLNLGAGAPPPAVPAGVAVRTPGQLDAAEVSLRLWACDLALLPLVDGVSTRRTTVMAALAHGVPVLGLRGVNTDRVFLENPDALSLTPAADRRAFARAAVELVADDARLRAVGEAGRRLYAEHFDWPVVARRVTAALETLPRRRVLERVT